MCACALVWIYEQKKKLFIYGQTQPHVPKWTNANLMGVWAGSAEGSMCNDNLNFDETENDDSNDNSMWSHLSARFWMSTHSQNWFRIIVCGKFGLEFISISYHSSCNVCLRWNKFSRYALPKSFIWTFNFGCGEHQNSNVVHVHLSNAYTFVKLSMKRKRDAENEKSNMLIAVNTECFHLYIVAIHFTCA